MNTNSFYITLLGPKISEIVTYQEIISNPDQDYCSMKERKETIIQKKKRWKTENFKYSVQSIYNTSHYNTDLDIQ